MAKVVEDARLARMKIAAPRENYVMIELCQEFEQLLLAKPFQSSKSKLVVR